MIESNIMEMKINYPEYYFFLDGDFNARTKDFKDFIPRDDLQYVSGDIDYERDDFEIPRKSKAI